MPNRNYLLMLLLLAAPLLFAGTPKGNLFNDSLSGLDAEMAKLTLVEQLIDDKHLTQSELSASQNTLADYLLPSQDLSSSLLGSTDPEHEQCLNVPGFLWGFCCSFMGVFIVYLSIENPEARKEEGRQAVWGCTLGTLLWAALYFWLLFTISTD